MLKTWGVDRMQIATIGVDIGTTNIKAVAFDLDGTQIGKESTPTLTHYPHPGWAYFSPDEIWESICLVLRRLMAKLPDGVTPGAIAFTGMAEAGVPVDAQGNPTHESIAWFDKRSEPQARWWAEHVGEERTASITGLPVNPVFGILKLLWIRANEPDAFAGTNRWLNVVDYGIFKLCGAAVTDLSLASRMLVLDLKNRCWSQTLLDAIDIPVAMLGEPVQSGLQVGQVHAEAAAVTGLPEGLPVCSGGHDHVCAAFALGLVRPGDVLDSMGTAEGIVLTTAQPHLKFAVTESGVGQGIHVVPGLTYAMSGLNYSGGAIDWSRRLLLNELESSASFEQLIRLAQTAPPGCDGVFFVPHLRRANPPFMDLHGRGAFIGVTSDATRAHFARAIMEGVAYDYQQAFDHTMAAFELEPRRQVATGGGTRNRLLMNIKANVSSHTISIPQVEEATCLGAAALAGVGAGLYTDHAEVETQIQYTEDAVEPNLELSRYYRERYKRIYLQLYDVLKSINHQISTLEAI